MSSRKQWTNDRDSNLEVTYISLISLLVVFKFTAVDETTEGESAVDTEKVLQASPGGLGSGSSRPEE